MGRIRAFIHDVAQKLANATRERRPPYRPDDKDLAGGIKHVVYEYSNLVFAHMFMESQPAGGPLAIVALNAFLLNSRQFADFFEYANSQKPDILAIHYSTSGRTSLPVCRKWKDTIDKQLAHISYSRVKDPKPLLTETQTRRDIYLELQAVFSKFVTTVQDPLHRAEFTRRLQERSSTLGIVLP